MITNTNLIIRKLHISDCTPELLDKYNNYQEIKKHWHKENNEWVLRDMDLQYSIIGNWDNTRKINTINGFVKCIEDNGFVIGAYFDDYLIGFAVIVNKLFGKNNEYIDLNSIFISYEFRNQGIGRKLFQEICIGAKQLGAQKLYISANSSEETVAFYKAIGCCEAMEINQELFEKEPFDVHMEYCLS